MSIVADSSGRMKCRGRVIGRALSKDSVIQSIAEFYAVHASRVHLRLVAGAGPACQWEISLDGELIEGQRVFPHFGQLEFAECTG